LLVVEMLLPDNHSSQQTTTTWLYAKLVPIRIRQVQLPRPPSSSGTIPGR
jgi:hypothetical protein